jgi:hypothetical protein
MPSHHPKDFVIDKNTEAVDLVLERCAQQLPARAAQSSLALPAQKSAIEGGFFG